MRRWPSNEVTAALVAAVVAGVVGALTLQIEDRKADAEFAELALSILAVDPDSQNPTARKVAMRILEETLPVEMSPAETVEWLSGVPVELFYLEWRRNPTSPYRSEIYAVARGSWPGVKGLSDEQLEMLYSELEDERGRRSKTEAQ